MSESARKFIFGVALLLAAGALIGWYYDETLWGLLVAALLTLLWQIRQLLSFDRALKTDDFDNFRVGDGIWQQIFSRVQFERDRGKRRKDSYRQLLREIRKSTDAMPDGAVILDAENEIVSSNRAAKLLAGLKRKKDKGHRIDNILRDPKLTALLESGDLGMNVDIPSPVVDGRWLNCRVVPYGGEQKLLFLRDVTDRIRLSKMRRDFVANASHELRSPLTVINGYLDALADSGDLPAEWEKPVVQMRGQSLRMKQILNEMLELSRLESSGYASRDATVEIATLLDSVRNDFERPTVAADIVINVESPARLLGRAGEIESVIVNLLSNALRYTPPDGTVTLTWRETPTGAELIVTDTGDGIDSEHIPRLTERFFRADRGRSRDEGGIGLGLAIVKHVLARHNAELAISSELGRGSEFRCRFPADRVVAENP
ncbi:MAG: phosphate regulon sensor histidine kinase PhoR [Gammaproteobacteria bacterium]|jgi:two-component system phosphate regulon sensor histidine kinase PhoR|nr:phosphate regulon sensor histidine kinase PhoR [Gammaproteobacteria bacterium]